MKIAVIFAVLAFGSQAFAEIDIALDFGPSFSNYSFDDGGSTVGDNHFGFTFLKTTESDWAWKIRAEYQSIMTSEMFPKDDFSFSAIFGLGGVLLKNEKLTLTLMPIIGIEYIDGDSIKTSNIKTEGNFIGFRTGIDFTGIYRLTKVVGFFTNIGLYYTIGSYEYEYGVYIDKNEYEYGVYIDKTYTKTEKDYSCSGWTFAPSIGVSLTFGN